MNIYLDTSALLKYYVSERGSDEVSEAVHRAAVTGTALITRTEMVAAFAKSVRMRVLPEAGAQEKLRRFFSDWHTITKVPLDEQLVTLAGELAWEHGLRGYDAVHLASALTWRRLMREPITLAVFDRKLWLAAGAVGLVPFPADLNPFLSP
ncbi:MAG TPA: type II toxin-antitoxin system VapC family toxin [Caldilineae bacterium]|nr:type II toxin-antitoxin system VapC family toxin [Caldilineae bacterium]